MPFPSHHVLSKCNSGEVKTVLAGLGSRVSHTQVSEKRSHRGAFHTRPHLSPHLVLDLDAAASSRWFLFVN